MLQRKSKRKIWTPKEETQESTYTFHRLETLTHRHIRRKDGLKTSKLSEEIKA